MGRNHLLGPFVLSLSIAGGFCSCAPTDDGGPDEVNAVGGAAGASGVASTRIPSGTIILTGAWPDGTFGTNSYRSSDTQVVQCVWDRQGATPVLWLLAGDMGSFKAASVQLEGTHGPTPSTAAFSADFDEQLEAIFRFGGEDERRLFEYAYATTDTRTTTCDLEVRTFDTVFSGHLACRDLIATSTSADFKGLDDPAMASVTLAFDCPLDVLGPAPTSSTGGQASTGGQTSTGGGTGTSRGSCRGSASPCSLVSDSACSLALGCSRDGRCSGSARSCYSTYGNYTCISQDGCYWSSASQNCSGSAHSCTSYSSSASCISQDGCHWSDTCEGTPWSCTSLSSEVDCELQPGCYWSSG